MAHGGCTKLKHYDCEFKNLQYGFQRILVFIVEVTVCGAVD